MILQDHFGQRSTGSFTLVVKGDGNADELVPQVRAAAERAAAELPTGRVVSVDRGERRRRRGADRLEPRARGLEGPDGRHAQGGRHDPRGRQVFLTGQAAIEHDLDPVFSEDLAKGEMIAIPIALLILVFTFGTLAFLLPFAFAIVTIPTTLGIIWIFANFMELTTYLTNLVTLIGLGIAIDYSLLIVYRFREELRRSASRDEAIVTTMGTAGRAVVFSGTAVAIGLAMLLFMPLAVHSRVRRRRPDHSGGVRPRGHHVPAGRALVRREAARPGAAPAEALDRAPGRPRARLLGGARAVHHALPEARRVLDRRVPASCSRSRCSRSQLGPGSNEGIPRDLEAVQGFDILSGAVGAGAVAPTAIVIDTGQPGRRT